MKKRLHTWWFTLMVAPMIRRYKADSTVVLKDAIVWQMHYGGIKPGQINKWLRTMGQKTIKGYMVLPNGKVNLFYDHPKEERRNQLGGRYITVEVK